MHAFICNAKTCKAKGRFGHNVWRYLDTGDSKSTSNLRRHAKGCWGEEAITAADRAEDADAARMVLRDRGAQNSSITSAFQRIGKAPMMYSNHQLTKTETQYDSPKLNHSYSSHAIEPKLYVGCLRTCSHSKLWKTVVFVN